MAAFKVLAALLVVCVAQNVAYAGFFDNKEVESFALMQAADFFGISNSVSRFVKCLPTLTEAYKWFQELKGHVREYRDINQRNRDAKEACDKMSGADFNKCLKDAEAAMVNAKVELFTKVDKFTTSTLEGYSQFKECIKTPASA